MCEFCGGSLYPDRLQSNCTDAQAARTTLSQAADLAGHSEGFYAETGDAGKIAEPADKASNDPKQQLKNKYGTCE